ncbi:hypothetical protein [Hymenobacter ruricola]|uniref:Uncharacterized protein n=1 Tax=Hymenobacter ruricola TaxID=2791023 RepID=A0ABS0I6C9_9BACT|nr:hypothetical protein [Hymenobacter ruricola]MBF9222457.1 hypothetical protein [Hymenobacter ruricola]
MKFSLSRPAALACLLTLPGALLLSSCNSEPKATEADKTATVVPSETNASSDSAAVTARPDSSAMGTDSTMAK